MSAKKEPQFPLPFQRFRQLYSANCPKQTDSYSARRRRRTTIKAYVGNQQLLHRTDSWIGSSNKDSKRDQSMGRLASGQKTHLEQLGRQKRRLRYRSNAGRWRGVRLERDNQTRGVDVPRRLLDETTVFTRRCPALILQVKHTTD